MSNTTNYIPGKVFGGEGAQDWLESPPEISADEIAGEYCADIIIVGGGHAGLHAAWAAGEKGAKVIVIEEQNEKHFSWWGEQIGHVNSQFLISRGFGPYDMDEIIDEFMKCSGQRANAKLISDYVRNSGEAFDAVMALVPKGGEIEKNITVQQVYGDVQYPVSMSGYKTWAGTACFRKGILSEPVKGIGAFSNLPDVCRMIKDKTEANGAKWFLNHTATVLVNDGGRVTGCIAKDKASGKYYRFTGKYVALTTGDFGANTKMCASLLDELSEWAARRNQKTVRGVFGRSGSGHKMGIWAGGRIEHSPRAAANFPRVAEPFGCPPFVFLNSRGKRYVNETVHASVTARYFAQPVGNMSVVFDSTWLTQLRQAGMNYHGNPDFGVPEYIEQAREDMQNVVTAGKNGYPVRSLANTERSQSIVYGANTLGELADFLGYSGLAKETFLESIERYNNMCKNGADLDYCRDKRSLYPVAKAPFYGIVSDNSRVDAGLFTATGLVTDDEMNVLNDNDEPIDGLYCAGNCLGGRYAIQYNTPISGNSIGMAMTHGRLLGKRLAEKLNPADF